MTHKVYVVTDLGPGDGGKGGVVHRVSTLVGAHTVVKVGGAQGSHGVRTSAGESFAFSQWGCGTLNGISTHISPRFVVSPHALLNEADLLTRRIGIHDPFEMLTVDEEALCASPFHGIASRLKEMARGSNPRGTIGTGVGEAYRMSERLPELTIRVRHLLRPDIWELIEAQREQVRQDLAEIIQGIFLPEDRALVQKELDDLEDDSFLEYVVDRYREVARRANIVDQDYFRREILYREGSMVVESSHGILTDRFHGFHPHTSAIRTLPRFTHEMLAQAGFDGRIVNLGVTRAYQIRHGAGPMPTADEAMAEHLLPGSHKENNRYQGKVRVGPLDFVLLRYAIDACGGPSAFDGLAITWFDQIQTNEAWHVCHRYQNADDPKCFTPAGDIIRMSGAFDGAEVPYQLAAQEILGQRLLQCAPEISTYEIPKDATRDELYQRCAGVLKEGLGVPVRMVSFGPTELDKMCE